MRLFTLTHNTDDFLSVLSVVLKSILRKFYARHVIHHRFSPRPCGDNIVLNNNLL